MIAYLDTNSTKFSQSGNKDKNHPDRQLIFELLATLKQKQVQQHPEAILMENVTEWLKANEFEHLQTTLAELGYHLSSRTYEASRFGLPQHRTRVFMVAVKKSFSQEPFEFPPEPLTREEASKVTLRQFLEDPRLSLSCPLIKGKTGLVYGVAHGKLKITWKEEFKRAISTCTNLTRASLVGLTSGSNRNALTPILIGEYGPGQVSCPFAPVLSLTGDYGIFEEAIYTAY